MLGKNVQDSVKVESILGLFDDVNSEMAKNFWKKDEQVVKQTLEKITPKLNNLAKFIGERSTAM